jgi:hypothetical protein
MSRGTARAVHGVTALVATGALVLQLALVVQGHRVLDETNPPALGTRLVRYASYLTIWSNVLAAVTTALLAVDPSRAGRAFRILRLDGLVLVALSGVVHFFLLRPLLELEGADLVADRLLHVAVPVLTVAGWIAVGPRVRLVRADLVPFLVIPVVWIGYTLVRGEAAGWYPYPFIDVQEHGYAVVLVNCLGVGALMVALFAIASVAEKELPGATRS